MASIVETLAGVYYNLRKPHAAPGFVIKPTAGADVTTSPTLTSGTGVPHDTNNAEPEGSLYTRIDAADGDTALYHMQAASWKALLGETA